MPTWYISGMTSEFEGETSVKHEDEGASPKMALRLAGMLETAGQGVIS